MGVLTCSLLSWCVFCHLPFYLFIDKINIFSKHTHTYVRVHVHVLHIHMYMYMYVFMYIHVHILYVYGNSLPITIE